MGALLSTASVEEQRTKLLSSQMSDSVMANLYQIQENIRWHETPLIKLWRNETDEEALLADMLRGEFIQEASVTLLPNKKNGVTSVMMYKAVKKDSVNYEFSTIKNARSIPSRIDTLTIKKIDFLEPFTNATDTLVTAVTPYYDKTGRHYAFITTTVRLYELLSCLNNMPDMGNGNVVFALSTSGVYLMHPDPKMRMNTPCSKDKKASAEFRRIFNDVRNDNKPDFNINIKWLEDFVRFEMNTAEYDGVRYVFSTFHEPYTGLTVMHGRPISVLDEEITSSISLATKFTFGMFVIAMLTLGLILRRMTRAIRSYSKASENIASGDFDTPLLIEKSYDERQILGEALENMRLSLQKNIKRIAEETAARETIEKELSIAHDIQMSMLPTKFPEAESSSKVDLYAFLRSAKEIGGDMYDFY
ncbi:MAG: hypothetical protein HUK08_06295, partial [Bacteroidaceae bacterium]|nr:hypothetical protein [Bacteroidaceae bacterium]